MLIETGYCTNALAVSNRWFLIKKKIIKIFRTTLILRACLHDLELPRYRALPEGYFCLQMRWNRMKSNRTYWVSWFSYQKLNKGLIRMSCGLMTIPYKLSCLFLFTQRKWCWLYRISCLAETGWNHPGQAERVETLIKHKIRIILATIGSKAGYPSGAR